MFNFLEISKQTITSINRMTININAHFITDTSQAWIFSNTKKQEGVCEVYIHYISPENNRKMMEEQPLWRGYIGTEIHDEKTKKQFLDNICDPIIHVIVNIHESYRERATELVNFIYEILHKNNPHVDEIIMDSFLYSEVAELEKDNI